MKEVAGMTYPVRAHLRALGGRWNPAKKCWEVPEARHAEALEVVQRQGPARINRAELVDQIRLLHFALRQDAGCGVTSDMEVLREAALRQELAGLEALLGRRLTETELWGS